MAPVSLSSRCVDLRDGGWWRCAVPAVSVVGTPGGGVEMIVIRWEMQAGSGLRRMHEDPVWEALVLQTGVGGCRMAVAGWCRLIGTWFCSSVWQVWGCRDDQALRDSCALQWGGEAVVWDVG